MTLETKGLDEILSGNEPMQERETVAEITAPEPTETQQTEGQPRAADGKFAPKATEPDTSAQQTVEGTEHQPQERGGVVPQQALHAAREKVRTETDRADRLEREMAELRGYVQAQTQQRQPEPVKEQPKPVDIWEDQNAWGQQLLTPIQQELQETRFMVSETRAVTKFGEETVETAKAALQEAAKSGQIDGPAVQAQLRQSRDPVGDIVRWHQQSPAVQEQSLREKLRAELMAEFGIDPGNTTPAPAAAVIPASPSVMPSNLAGRPNVGTRSGPAWSGPAPLGDIFDRTRKTG